VRKTIPDTADSDADKTSANQPTTGGLRLRLFRARNVYRCDGCGATIGVRTPYFRGDPFPMARFYRGERTRHFCTSCAVGIPTMAFGTKPPRAEFYAQMKLNYGRSLDRLPGFLVQGDVLALSQDVDQGRLVEFVAPAWFAIATYIERDPAYLYRIDWREFEELIAGAYERDGWTVVLTPRSADRGRDIIATQAGLCQIRIIDQVKRYGQGHRVTADEVRAVLGVLSSERNTTKAFVTTTADFAPGIRTDPTIVPFLPYRLELRDGTACREWLKSIARRSQ